MCRHTSQGFGKKRSAQPLMVLQSTGRLLVICFNISDNKIGKISLTSLFSGFLQSWTDMANVNLKILALATLCLLSSAGCWDLHRWDWNLFWSCQMILLCYVFLQSHLCSRHLELTRDCIDCSGFKQFLNVFTDLSKSLKLLIWTVRRSQVTLDRSPLKALFVLCLGRKAKPWSVSHFWGFDKRIPVGKWSILLSNLPKETVEAGYLKWVIKILQGEIF